MLSTSVLTHVPSLAYRAFTVFVHVPSLEVRTPALVPAGLLVGICMMQPVPSTSGIHRGSLELDC